MFLHPCLELSMFFLIKAINLCLVFIFISVNSHLDWTAVQLSAHAYVAVPCQRMDSDKTGMEWRKDLVNDNGVPIEVAPKNLK